MTRQHRVETWWTTATYAGVCLDCPWQTEGPHAEVAASAEQHSQPRVEVVPDVA